MSLFVPVREKKVLKSALFYLASGRSSLANLKKKSLNDEFIIKNLMKKDILEFTPDTPVLEIVKRMTYGRKSFATITDHNDSLLGLISHFDIFSNIKTAEDLQKPCKAIMNTKIQLIDENEDIIRASEIMVENNVQRLPVVNKNNKIVGMISSGYILQYIERISVFMTKEVVTIDPDSELFSAVDKMLMTNIGSLVVVKNSLPIAIITHQDLTFLRRKSR